MTARYFLTALALFLGLTACSGGKDTTGTTTPTGDDDDDDDDDDDTAPTGETGGGFFDASVLLVDANFAYDSTTRTIVDATSSYGTIPSSVGLYFGTTAWEATGLDFAETTEYCTIIYPLAGAGPNTTWPAAASLWAGFDYDPAAGTGTNCYDAEYGLDPAAWGSQLHVDLAGYGWGVGVGELWPDYVASYSTGTLAEEVFGGYINNTFLTSPQGQETYISAARQIDASYNLVVGGDGNLILLETSAVNLGNNIATAHYLIIPRSYWIFE